MNKLVYKLDNYKNVDDLYQAVFDEIKMLAQHKLVYVFYQSVVNPSHYVLEFSYTDPEFGYDLPMWVTADEAEVIFNMRGQSPEDIDINIDNIGGTA